MGNSYAVFERIYWLIQKEEFFLKDYMDKFDISRRTAFRDLTYLKEYQNIDVESYEGKYYLHKLSN